MKIIRASVLGFCFGVRRAVELAEKALAENPDKTVVVLLPDTGERYLSSGLFD